MKFAFRRPVTGRAALRLRDREGPHCRILPGPADNRHPRGRERRNGTLSQVSSTITNSRWPSDGSQVSDQRNNSTVRSSQAEELLGKPELAAPSTALTVIGAAVGHPDEASQARVTLTARQSPYGANDSMSFHLAGHLMSGGTEWYCVP